MFAFGIQWFLPLERRKRRSNEGRINFVEKNFFTKEERREEEEEEKKKMGNSFFLVGFARHVVQETEFD